MRIPRQKLERNSLMFILHQRMHHAGALLKRHYNKIVPAIKHEYRYKMLQFSSSFVVSCHKILAINEKSFRGYLEKKTYRTFVTV